jgi:16S rRNA (cytosine1402-N4)-methyltransferase
MHVPVMLSEAIEWLRLDPLGVYLDATCGLGGHTGAIAERLTSGLVFSNDRDLDSLRLAQETLTPQAARIVFSHGPFSTLAGRFRAGQLGAAAGMLADLGVSRYQLTGAERGFSFMSDGPLDMRMDRSTGETAADLVNFSPEKELANLIYQFGEERRSRQIARAIVRARPINSTLHLARVVEQAAPRTGRLHPATQTFMALRLVVNGELDEVEALLRAAPEVLGRGARLVVITFHSIEDRIVKQGFQRLARETGALVLTRHVIFPSQQEQRENPSARSAKLRALEMPSDLAEE